MVRDPRVTTNAWHLFIFRYDPAGFGGRDRADFLKALRAEGVPCSPGYVPLHHSPAVKEETAKLWHALGRHQGPPLPEVRLPVAERAGYAEGVWLTQNVLLGERADMDDVVEAVAKLQAAQ
jgi:dTDP-4-amino-4,6-dideoxygalactose transaminase